MPLEIAVVAGVLWGTLWILSKLKGGTVADDLGVPYDPRALPPEWQGQVGHFKLSEFLVTSNPSLQRVPSIPSIRSGLMRLIAVTLEPLRAQFGPLKITSGYRSNALNTAIGGSATSDHRNGYAADLKATSNHDAHAMARWISASSVPFDQAIWYEPACGGHLHISLRPGSNRRQVLHCVVENGKKHYREEM